MNLAEYDDLKYSIEKVTKKIFEIYSSFADLEILGEEKSKEYKDLREELKIFTRLERELYQKMFSDSNHFKQFYEAVFGISEYHIDIENYLFSGKSDSLYYNRIPRQLERVVHFQDIRMELPSDFRVQGSYEQREQFIYTMFALLTLQDQDIQYERLLAVEQSLREEPFLDEEREIFIRLKYYYIFVNFRAEEEFLSPSYMRNRKFKKDGQYSLDILNSTENQIQYFRDAYQTYYQSKLLEQTRVVIERWCSYPNQRFKYLDVMDLFLTIELQTLLLMMGADHFDEVRGLVMVTNEAMRACDNNYGRYYALRQIFSCIDSFEKDFKDAEEIEEVKKAKEKEYKI